MTGTAESPAPGFDRDALREKYREERQKRLRPEGNDQYVEVAGEFGHLLDDPYVAPGYTRAPSRDEALGYDLAAGTLDMLVRWAGDGGHCPIHRHTATTSVLVLEGEQHLWDLHADGRRGEHRVRRAGGYALTSRDALPHLERGGPKGGLAFFGSHSADGLLYEILDEDLNLVANVTLELLIEDWKAHA